MRRAWGHLAASLAAVLVLTGCGANSTRPPAAIHSGARLPSYLTALDFLSQNVGWVASYNWSWPVGDRDQAVFRTLDGGRTWKSFSTGQWKIVRMLFRTPNVGWAIAESSCTKRDTCSRVDILVTLDGGQHWGLGWSQRVKNLESTTALDSLGLQFPGRNTGYASVAGRVLKTTDGGFTWNVLHLPTGETPRWISFPRHRSGWVVAATCTGGTCSSSIFATRDGGGHWTPQASFQDSGGSWYGGIFFLGATHGWVYSKAEGSESGLLYRTTDGGRHWQLAATDVASGEAAVGQPDFITTAIGWLPVDAQNLPVSGGLLRTTDGGRTWTPYGLHGSFPVSISAISFVSPSEGWALERVGGNPHEALAVTHSGGRTWAPVPVAAK